MNRRIGFAPAFSTYVLAAAFALLSAAVPPAAAQDGVACASEPTDMTIAYGAVVNCSIAPVGDLDTFRFTATAGETVLIQGVIGAASSVRPCVELVAPDNSRLRACENAFVNRIDAVLTQSGTYTILFSDRTSFFSGAYTLVLERVLPPSAGARAVAYGQTLQDRIDLRGDLDLFVFNGTANDVVVISVAIGTGSGVRPCVELVAPGNVRSSACNNAFTNRLDATLRTTGPHTLLVRDNSNAFTGGYSIALQCLIGQCTSGPPPPGPGVPGAPSNLVSFVTGSTVALDWSAPSVGNPPTSYVIEAGSTPGASNVAVVDSGSNVRQLTAVGVPAGVYYVRARARNAAGVGPASNEITVVVGGGPGPCVGAPGAPSGLGATIVGRIVTLNWTAAGGPLSTYVVDVGGSPGTTNITSFETGDQRTTLVATAPPGRYYVRLRARNACGTSGPSNEVLVAVQ